MYTSPNADVMNLETFWEENLSFILNAIHLGLRSGRWWPNLHGNVVTRWWAASVIDAIFSSESLSAMAATQPKNADRDRRSVSGRCLMLTRQI